MLAQGWENYRKEFKQLRRSFRYNEYSDIRELNPPTTFVGRARTPRVCVLAQCCCDLSTGTFARLTWPPRLQTKCAPDNGQVAT